MAKETTWYQCSFRQDRPDGTTWHAVAWIDEKGAKLGAKVELIGEEGLWTVASIDDKPISHAEFKRLTLTSRMKWASLMDE